MINLMFATADEIKISQKEVFRYLGCSSEKVSDQVKELALDCIKNMQKTLSCKACFDIFTINTYDDMFDLGFTTTSSESLKKNLSGCTEIVLFAATIGAAADRFIQKYSLLSPSYALAAQAVGTAAIESWCDLICSKIESNLKKYLRPRFSPGYGDFPLSKQKDIFAVLDCPRKIGVSLTDSLIMTPSKSVSAITGITDIKCAAHSCENCTKTECIFRRV